MNGRIVREYVGMGPKGEAAAAADVREKAARRAEAEAWEASQERWQIHAELLDELASLTTLLGQVTLYAAGYHQHDGGEWRLRYSHPNNEK